MKTITKNGWKYDCETTQKGKSFKELRKPKGAELWTLCDFESFTEKEWEKLGLDNDWFFIKQYHPNLRNTVAGFSAVSGGSNFYCYGYPEDSYSFLGVRWKRKVKSKGVKQK